MRCYKDFKDDRTCDLCKISNNTTFEECKKDFEDKRDLVNRLWKIEYNCPYKTICYDEYDKFYGCNKYGQGHGRHAEVCKPNLECEQCCKGGK